MMSKDDIVNKYAKKIDFMKDYAENMDKGIMKRYAKGQIDESLYSTISIGDIPKDIGISEVEEIPKKMSDSEIVDKVSKKIVEEITKETLENMHVGVDMGKKGCDITGVFMNCDEPNKNGRMYPFEVMKKAIEEFAKKSYSPNGFKVYHDPKLDGNKIIVGYKGKEVFDAGYIYAPYVPIFTGQFAPDNIHVCEVLYMAGITVVGDLEDE